MEITDLADDHAVTDTFQDVRVVREAHRLFGLIGLNAGDTNAQTTGRVVQQPNARGIRTDPDDLAHEALDGKDIPLEGQTILMAAVKIDRGSHELADRGTSLAAAVNRLNGAIGQAVAGNDLGRNQPSEPGRDDITARRPISSALHGGACELPR